MKIIMLTTVRVTDVGAHGIYTDLLREFCSRGDDVSVLTPQERRFGKKASSFTQDGIRVIQVPTGNITRSRNPIEKAISTIRVEGQFIKTIERQLANERFDLVLYSTPPVTFARVVTYLKRRDNASTYLLLKDIFPQNAVDLHMMRGGGIIHGYFRRKEKKLYAASDYIGCMSKANVRYLLKNNPEISEERVEVCPNSIEIRPAPDFTGRGALRKKYGIPPDAVTFVYGGSLGKPQGVDFMLEAMRSFHGRKDLYFLVVGAGTEQRKVEQGLRDVDNARFLSFMPRQEYEQFLCIGDVGLIFLDRRFTIPNFPSRLLAYFEAGLPVLSATDSASDVGQVVEDAGAGIGVQSGDLPVFRKAVERLAKDGDTRRRMGKKGHQRLLRDYSVERACDIIKNHFQ